jgi:hypothetical protein
MAKVKVDFSKVEDGGRIRVPEGDYRVKIVESRLKDSQAGNSMIVWDFEFLDGKYRGKKITTNTVLTPKSLWVLRKLIDATGSSIPKKLVELDTRKYHDMELGITVTDNEYEDKNGNSRVSSQVSDFIDPDAVKVEDDESDGDLDEITEDKTELKIDKGKKGKKDKKKKKSEDDEVEDLDLDEL